jgi:hypothetical protein
MTPGEKRTPPDTPPQSVEGGAEVSRPDSEALSDTARNALKRLARAMGRTVAREYLDAAREASPTDNGSALADKSTVEGGK